jgi:hypothetical protein
MLTKHYVPSLRKPHYDSRSQTPFDKHFRRPLVPKSSYYFGPPPADAAYGSNPVGKLGTHHPREVIRLERDYTGGELIQFSSAFPLELEGRVSLIILAI